MARPYQTHNDVPVEAELSMPIKPHVNCDSLHFYFNHCMPNQDKLPAALLPNGCLQHLQGKARAIYF